MEYSFSQVKYIKEEDVFFKSKYFKYKHLLEFLNEK